MHLELDEKMYTTLMFCKLHMKLLRMEGLWCYATKIKVEQG